ncbi:DNA cytosine methyltransferase [Kitasatospora paracochleata]|uniref:DNA (cytosine-5-)-methyltransferase n=1 Tax=Kitasatospora paracochleata TaxID=58354 RepID=A0ABT1ITW3_9ACTN|nr:DNA (cytosine-5)-methyltransferase 1 [Kitasatospora paracochleata]
MSTVDEPGTAPRFSSIEICSGSGAQALGLEQAGFDPVLLIDNKADACRTIGQNRRRWKVLCEDLLAFDPSAHPQAYNVDLISGGLPRIKAAAAVRRDQDIAERELLRAAVRLVGTIRPKALLLENLPELVEKHEYAEDLDWIENLLAHLGYTLHRTVLNAAGFGVPQNRRSGFLVALAEPFQASFAWPRTDGLPTPTVGEALGASMAARGWPGAQRWAEQADRPAPALVGGSDRRGGADLGPTGSKRAWAALGINGNSLSDDFPPADFPVDAHPRLNIRQAAMIQCIPEDWIFFGRKTSVYRQIGHSMPPPLATAVGRSLATALSR